MVAAISSSSAYTPAIASGTGSASATAQDHATSQTSQNSGTGSTSGSSQQLNRQQQDQIAKLQRIDADVRAHEQAHLAAAGGLVISGPNYDYTLGPDGKRYATGGDVEIDVSPGNTPQETLRKARIIAAAALAPQDPSGQDRRVAAQAEAMAAQAELEISQQSGAQQKVASTYSNNGQSNQPTFAAYA